MGRIISSSTITSGLTGSFDVAIFKNLPTTQPTTTGSVWISGSSQNHPNSGFLMIFNP
jgi:hypothetical protein